MFIVDVTERNVDEYRRALAGLKQDGDLLRKTVNLYPLDCRLAGYRHVFETAAEIDLFIRMIEVDLERFNRSHPATPLSVQ